MKEVDLAITADMGTLQRLPGIVGDGTPTRPRLCHQAVALSFVACWHEAD